jgi:hypothetical protein
MFKPGGRLMKQRDSRSYRYGGRVVPALVVIGIGVFFLLGNFGFDFPFLYVQNWWAWLILIAAWSPLSHALRRYSRVGTVDNVVLHSLLSAAAIVMVALIFILGLSWARWWPIFVIYGGLSMLVRESWRGRGSAEVDLPDRDKTADGRSFDS